MRLFLWLTGISIVALNILVIADAHSFFALYYVFWLGIIGLVVWRYRTAIERALQSWRLNGFLKFVVLGIAMILIEETIAALSNSGDVLQFWAFNLLTLSGFVVGWYLLTRWIAYGKREVFVLAGIYGLYAEQILQKVVAVPIFGVLLILPTMAAYMLIIAPSIMSASKGRGRHLNAIFRWILALVVPVVVSVPFIFILVVIRAHAPGIFPPVGLIQ
ncbi:MAG: hypothetical protein KGI79_01785 [Patescibacteria group bacterium]|nr:hypothetical protein [Patescibacteria group bacterium]MDE2116582.1 hypothetical protein [Patescibacteria group bacterium]